MKVYAIPPPIIKLSTTLIKFVKTWILEETLAPPIIAKTGGVLFLKTLSKTSTSFESRKPIAFFPLKKPGRIPVEAWFL